jgi:hypothetical protein
MDTLVHALKRIRIQAKNGNHCQSLFMDFCEYLDLCGQGEVAQEKMTAW